jgi:hypothetical protein
MKQTKIFSLYQGSEDIELSLKYYLLPLSRRLHLRPWRCKIKQVNLTEDSKNPDRGKPI